ncbi:MAG: hypothetical protein Q8K20_18545 [Gemmobacter sp.]|nr:hypothetical protein [Gemmobacter sp.]
MRIIRCSLLFAASFALMPLPTVAESVFGDGFAMGTQVTTGVRLHPGSELRRPWQIVSAEKAEAKLLPTGFTGVFPRWDDSSKQFALRAELRLSVAVPVTAIRVTFDLYDVWGAKVQTLHYDRIEDLPAGEHTAVAGWSRISEVEARQVFATYAYVSRVRLANGTIKTVENGLLVDNPPLFQATPEVNP